jgi:glycosyltransferase involved in cell wall biosynthesis
MERDVLRAADMVTCASRTHEKALRDALGAPGSERVRFVPNGVDAQAASAATPGAPSAAATSGRARVVFTGTLVETPAMRAFLEALARAIGREPGLRERIEVVVAGPYEATYDGLVTSLGLTGVVRLLGPVAREEARRLQREASVLLLVRNEGPGYAAMVPGKLYEYLDARRPLVAMIGEGEAAELARACGALVVAPGEGDRAAAAAIAAATGAASAPRPDERAINELLAGRSREALAGTMARVLEEARAARTEAR